MFDKRGTGLSDRGSEVPSLDQRMDDARAVMDAAGMERAAMLGVSEGGPLAILFAATYPERCQGLVLYGTFARSSWITDEVLKAYVDYAEKAWGSGLSPAALGAVAKGRRRLPEVVGPLRTAGREPGGRHRGDTDGQADRHRRYPALRPCADLGHPRHRRHAHRRGLRTLSCRADPGAKLIELPGNDHLFFLHEQIGDAIEEFLTGSIRAAESHRVLATVLFTDIVGSTALAEQLGDRRWRDLLDAHHATVRRELSRARGKEVKSLGDGFLATFDGPARAVRCARSITEAVGLLNLKIRSGLHTGEIEIVDNDVQGIAVHIASRISALAGPGEVLVSRTVQRSGRRVRSLLQRARQTFAQGSPRTDGPLRGFELTGPIQAGPIPSR